MVHRRVLFQNGTCTLYLQDISMLMMFSFVLWYFNASFCLGNVVMHFDCVRMVPTFATVQNFVCSLWFYEVKITRCFFCFFFQTKKKNKTLFHTSLIIFLLFSSLGTIFITNLDFLHDTAWGFDNCVARCTHCM